MSGYIRRHIESSVRRLSEKWSALLLTGPRQSGKTTLLRQMAEGEGGRTYVTLDDLNARALAKNDPGGFLQLYAPPVLIDEVQFAPELFPYIKMYIDEHPEPGAFWLTGSQVFGLPKGVSESLAGRVALLNMTPLSQRELNGAEPLEFTPDMRKLAAAGANIRPLTVTQMFERIWRGSMPGLCADPGKDRDVYYSSYVSTYLERDIRELSGAIDALKFSKFITAVAARAGQLVNFSAIAEDADINQSQAKAWLNVLEALGVIFLLHPYSNNVLRRTIKTPKLYFYDTGLVCYLTKWSSPEVAECGAMNGALLENFAVSEIVKNYYNVAKQPFLHYYRDHDAKEIDIVMERDGQLFPMEIKKTALSDRRITRAFDLLDKPPLLRGTSAVLCMATSLGAFDRNNLIVPIWLL